MAEYILKDIFKNKYKDITFNESNYVRNILQHFLEYERCGVTGDKRRLQYDCDVYYYKNVKKLSDEDALCGDTMISFWTLYRLAIRKHIGKWYSKKEESLEALIKQIDQEEPEILEINKRFEEFARLYYTKGNFILLPCRKMNTERYRRYRDRIDETIYQCFEGGKLASYFKGDKDLYRWIRREKLSTIFNGGEKKKENINPFIGVNKSTFSYSNLDEIYLYIDKGVELIKERNKQYQ